jgi:DNA invertase Pin-like site-specific DNA recombinase|nr:MAG TPA: integrase [Caudoviricetes sp.]
MQRIIRRVEPITPALPVRKRVAAYARVSSGKDAMLHSLSAQISYYSNLIQKRPDWDYVGVYADEALTGTKDTRQEFVRLMDDCRAGKIDIVLTKSISRFARNTVTMLESVRELKSIGIDVFFERENIHSMSGDGELMLTILASFAQEESRSASENQKWRIRKQYEIGRPGSTTIMGYKLVDGVFYVIPKEAQTVQLIYDLYLSGLGKNAIMKRLNEMRIPSKHGGTWNESCIHSVLTNEKYKGDILLQKSYVVDHLKKLKKKNEGELPMYYVRGSHEAIIDEDTFERVQTELKRRSDKYHVPKTKREIYPFTAKIRCGLCGKNYRRKTAAAGTKYEKIVWICSTFDKFGKSHCQSQQIPEQTLMKLTADVMGLSKFDECKFDRQICQILIPSPSTVIFCYHNGDQFERTWQNPSRRESWDEQAREIARQRQLEINDRRRNES